MTDETQKVPSYLWQFAQDQQVLSQAAREIDMYLAEIALAASVTVHAISARAKTLASYGAKSANYADPATQIFDSVAARVILFTTSARNDLVELVKARTVVHEHQNPGKRKFNGYDSEHLVITDVLDDDARARYPGLAQYLRTYPGLEIQFRSVAAHAWAEYEHDVRYKPGAYQDLPQDRKDQINQWFVEAGGMRRVMDDLFARIEQTLITETADTALPAEAVEADVEPEEVNDAPLSVETLGALLAARHPIAERGDKRSMESLVEQLATVDVTAVGKLERALAEVEPGYVAQLMDYPEATTGVRRLDDEILAAFTDRWVDSANDSNRTQLLQLRLRRVRGKFAIYSVESEEGTSPLMTAARTVRHLVALVADAEGVERVEIDGAISQRRENLNSSTKPRVVRTSRGAVNVASNLSRTAAEDLMRILVDRTAERRIRVIRAGDTFLAVHKDDGGPNRSTHHPTVTR
ncbi:MULTISPECIES: hypothetical protein [unclassified Curtobacterium]|uniref:hypothetical protein n=1 Tax=unclassified Curtobacterium TaxID=257496 RepID=UPI000FA85CF3|nr:MULTISPECIES: hypothetical protein [unclassified Curtobacterium]ROQ04785.1 RelA/SpoT family protein [Curtobacterium sp. PhB171]ROQ28265.1 RelA/SpoT family protein [Curtobacterium sp. PhB170]ROS33203.1 RelA/SpoT family protein [Curtobacterium sp. PhB131]ROS72438.1 RelA/SpoT family protein [Curtobacterium sp. PhB141]